MKRNKEILYYNNGEIPYMVNGCYDCPFLDYMNKEQYPNVKNDNSFICLVTKEIFVVKEEDTEREPESIELKKCPLKKNKLILVFLKGKVNIMNSN